MTFSYSVHSSMFRTRSWWRRCYWLTPDMNSVPDFNFCLVVFMYEHFPFSEIEASMLSLFVLLWGGSSRSRVPSGRGVSFSVNVLLKRCNTHIVSAQGWARNIATAPYDIAKRFKLFTLLWIVCSLSEYLRTGCRGELKKDDKNCTVSVVTVCILLQILLV
jgi:hypothetical protein